MKKIVFFFLWVHTFANAQVTDSLLNLTIPLEQRVSLFMSRIEPFGFEASLALQFKKQTVFLPKDTYTHIPWNKIQAYTRAIAFLDAQEERKFSIQNPIKSFYKNTPSYANPISLDDLLSHKAGLHRCLAAHVTVDSLWWWVKKEKQAIYSAYHDSLADFIFEKMTGMSPLQWFKTKIYSKTGAETDTGMDVIAFLQLEELLMSNKILQPTSLDLMVKPYKIENGKGYSYAWRLSETLRQTPVAFAEDSSFSLRLYPVEGLRIAAIGQQANVLVDVLVRYLTDGLPNLPPKIQNLRDGALDTLNGIWTGQQADFQVISKQNKVKLIPLNAQAYAWFQQKKVDKSISILQHKFPTTDSLLAHLNLEKNLFQKPDSLLWLDKKEKQVYICRSMTENNVFEVIFDETLAPKKIQETRFLEQTFLPTGTQSLEAWIYPYFPKCTFSKSESGWLLELKQEKIYLKKK